MFLLRLPMEAKTSIFPIILLKLEVFDLWLLQNGERDLQRISLCLRTNGECSAWKALAKHLGIPVHFTQQSEVADRGRGAVPQPAAVYFWIVVQRWLCACLDLVNTNSKPACVSSYHHLPVLGISNNHSVADIAEGNQMLPLFWQLL